MLAEIHMCFCMDVIQRPAEIPKKNVWCYQECFHSIFKIIFCVKITVLIQSAKLIGSSHGSTWPFIQTLVIWIKGCKTKLILYQIPKWPPYIGMYLLYISAPIKCGPAQRFSQPVHIFIWHHFVNQWSWRLSRFLRSDNNSKKWVKSHH